MILQYSKEVLQTHPVLSISRYKFQIIYTLLDSMPYDWAIAFVNLIS